MSRNFICVLFIVVASTTLILLSCGERSGHQIQTSGISSGSALSDSQNADVLGTGLPGEGYSVESGERITSGSFELQLEGGLHADDFEMSVGTCNGDGVEVIVSAKDAESIPYAFSTLNTTRRSTRP